MNLLSGLVVDLQKKCITKLITLPNIHACVQSVKI